MLINALNIKWPFTLNTRTKFNTHLMHILAAFTLEFGLRQCELNTHWTNPPLEVDWNRIGTEFIVFSSNDNKIMHSYEPLPPPPWAATCQSFRFIGHNTCCIRCPRYTCTMMAYHARMLLTRCCQKKTAYKVISCSSLTFTFHVI